MAHGSELQSRTPRVSFYRRVIWALTALSSLALATPLILVLSPVAQAQEATAPQEATVPGGFDLAPLSAEVRAAAEAAREAEARALEAAESARSAAINGERARGNTVSNGNGVAELQRGARYAGGFSNRNFHGFGIYEFGEGATLKYEGAFRDGHMDGDGIYYWRSGGRYAGHRKEGARDGAGVYYFADGRRFEGLWSGDARNGPGVEWSASGRVRRAGVWRDNGYVGETANAAAAGAEG
jgi:hypothetical protein